MPTANLKESVLAAETYVLERVAQLLEERHLPWDAADLARQIMGTIQAGDDIGNGLRAIPIAALEELSEFLKRNGHQTR